MPALAARRVLGTVALSAGLLLAGSLAAPAAQAHAELVSSSPADGATVASMPAKVVLTFGEPMTVRGAAIVVTSPSGRRVDVASTLAASGSRMSVRLAGDGEDGTYTTSYRVVSEDGHPVEGALTFRVGSASTAPTLAPSPTETSSTGAGSSSGWMIIGGLVVVLLGLGGYVALRGRRGRHAA